MSGRDIRSCVACGHCTYICPAAHYERNFTPRGIAEKFILHGRQGIDLWSCLTCHACVEVCPEGVDFPRFMREAREGRDVLEIPVRTHAGVVEAMRKLQASGKGGVREADWLQPELETDPSSTTALFVGCVPLLDVMFADVAPGLTRTLNASIFLLNRMGIRPRLLPLERCCGHDAYWLGEVETFRSLAEWNIEMFRKEGVQEVITVCPECSHTLGDIYPEVLDRNGPKVRHISQVISEGISDGRLRPFNGGTKITFQDPCRLGRMSKEYVAPRTVISAVGDLEEMARSKEMASCCGSTCFMQCDMVVKKWQVDRLEEARGTRADLLVTACPKCRIHLGCAQKDIGTYKSRPKIPIKDVTLLLAENLGWKG